MICSLFLLTLTHRISFRAVDADRACLDGIATTRRRRSLRRLFADGRRTTSASKGTHRRTDRHVR